MPHIAHAALEAYPGAQSVKETPIKGVYEVTTSGEVFYRSDGGYILFGDLRTPDGRSLTAEALKPVILAKLEKLPLHAAIKVGTGPIKVIEFIDPLCPHSKKLAEHMSDIPDVTRYIFLPAIKGWRDEIIAATILSGNVSLEKASDTDALEPRVTLGGWTRLKLHRHAYHSMGLKAVPAIWIGSTFLLGADLALVDKELERARNIEG